MRTNIKTDLRNALKHQKKSDFNKHSYVRKNLSLKIFLNLIAKSPTYNIIHYVRICNFYNATLATGMSCMMMDLFAGVSLIKCRGTRGYLTHTRSIHHRLIKLSGQTSYSLHILIYCVP